MRVVPPAAVRQAQEAASRLMATTDGVLLFGPAVLDRAHFDASKILVRPSTPNHLVFPFTATPDVCNAFQSAHGGALATLGDIFTTIHLWGMEPGSRHVSVGFSIQFLSAAEVGKQFECRTAVAKKGKRLAFTEFQFVDTASGSVVATGSHTKSFLSS